MPANVPAPMRRSAFAAIAMVAAWITCAGALAQVDSNLPGAGFGPADVIPAPPTIHVYSRETVVNVLVTDDQGESVHGLTQANFTVFEDGKRQPITSVVEVSKATSPAPAPPLPPNTWINVASMPAAGPVQIFLFDLLASAPQDILRSRQYIADYLRTMPAGTQVALFALSPTKGLRLLHSFTSDGPLAASIVEKLDPEWIHNPVRATSHRHRRIESDRRLRRRRTRPSRTSSGSLPAHS